MRSWSVSSEAHRWKFCTGQQLLEVDPSPPLDRYETAFHMPSFEQGTPYHIHTCRIDGAVQRYEIMADRIYCDVDPASALIASIPTASTRPSGRPPSRCARSSRMAQMLAVAVTRNSAQIKAMSEGYEVQLSRAKNRDAQSVTPKRVNPEALPAQPHHAGSGVLML